MNNDWEKIDWGRLDDEIVAPYMTKTMAEIIKKFDESQEIKIPSWQDKEYNHEDFMKFLYNCKVEEAKAEFGEEAFEKISKIISESSK